jgi:hypothetical protein
MTVLIEKPYSPLIREFTNIHLKASELIKPLVAELKLKHFPTLESLKSEENSIKHEMRKSFPIDQQALLSKTDKFKYQNKTLEEQSLMDERTKLLDRVKYLWNLLVKEMFPPSESFQTPVKSSNPSAKMVRSGSGSSKRNSLSRPCESTTASYENEEAIRIAGDSTPVENQYLNVPETLQAVPHNPYHDLHHFDLPLRMCIVAPSGSGMFA